MLPEFDGLPQVHAQVLERNALEMPPLQFAQTVDAGDSGSHSADSAEVLLDIHGSSHLQRF